MFLPGADPLFIRFAEGPDNCASGDVLCSSQAHCELPPYIFYYNYLVFSCKVCLKRSNLFLPDISVHGGEVYVWDLSQGRNSAPFKVLPNMPWDVQGVN